ncbi:MAG TPA: TolC family protein [Candidatus Eisenbacteria bacterium]|nr:TolC family protein [Candidatus Eisenbacteria bacterium]
MKARANRSRGAAGPPAAALAIWANMALTAIVPVRAAAQPADTSSVAIPAAATTPATAGPRIVTLQEALDLAARYAPRSIAAAGSKRVNDAALRSSYAAFLPSLSLSADATRQFPSRGGTRIENGQVVTLPAEPWSENAGFNASMTLFQGGGRIFELRQARAQAAAAGINAESERYGVALDTKTRYYAVLAARELVAAAEARLAQAREGLDAALARVRARTATRSDSLRAVIEWRNAELEELDARRGIASAEASLTRAIGSPEPVTAAPLEAADSVSLALDDARLRALAMEGPAIQRARKQRDAARAAASASWTHYLPTITASYSRSGSGSSPELDLGGDFDSYSGSFRLSASLPIFDRLAREEGVVRSRVALENAEADLSDVRLGSVESLEQSLGDFHATGKRLEAQTASVEAAEEDLRVQQERYRTGAGTILDVLTSQTTLHQARLSLIQARYDRRIAKAELEALLGRDL